MWLTSPVQGWIFLCNNTTEEECFRRSLVGIRETYLQRLKSLEPGDPVLLYNFESALLVAQFAAVSKPGLDIVPEAYGKRYRAHVQVKLERRFAPPLPRQKLETIPDLRFNEQGYLANFSVPIEVISNIIDLATGRKGAPGEPAGKEEKDFRRKFPPKFLCSDGHWVRSKAELLIDNWLYTRKPPIAHAYERRLPVSEEAYCDFYIPICDCYIEYWGLDTLEYSARQRRKLELFEKYAFNVIQLVDRDIEELDDRLPEKLLRVLPKGYRLQ